MQGEYKEIDYDTLDDFWDAISPIGEVFGNSLSRFIFRGQRDSTWRLSPQVYRREVIDKYNWGLGTGSPDHLGQTFFEWKLLQSFIYHCDERGLSIPSDSMEFREYFSLQNMLQTSNENYLTWPENKVMPLMAIAQHHGVPTRLLDWSFNSMVACYFAAVGAVNEDTPSKDKRIAVFGFTFDPHEKGAGYRWITVPGSTSVNLAAQAGTFILVNNSGSRGDDFSFDVSLESELGHNDRLIKLTLPIGLAGELLERCELFGVSGASVFPGYDGVAKAILERSRTESFHERLI